MNYALDNMPMDATLFMTVLLKILFKNLMKNFNEPITQSTIKGNKTIK